MDTLRSIKLFRELLCCGDTLFLWCYDAEGTLLHSNCSAEDSLGNAFVQFGCKAEMLRHATQSDKPIHLGTALGLFWSAAFEKSDDELLRCWVVGPMFYLDISTEGIEKGLEYYQNAEMSVARKIRFLEAVRTLPIIPSTMMQRYTLMLHYCVSGEKLNFSDITYGPNPKLHSLISDSQRDRHKVYMAEKQLLDAVRSGNLNYHDAFSASMAISSGVPVESSEALRQVKISLIVFATLVGRAAIEGGMSPEEAYSLSDKYIQNAENSKSMSELAPLASALYDDFIRRVHKIREISDLSPAIRKCCRYIELYPEKKHSAEDMAVLTGYSAYYLTQKFKEETGSSLSDYVKKAKINRAKVLLESEQSIAEIAAELNFCTRSYFSRVFAEVTGKSPSDYRKKLF